MMKSIVFGSLLVLAMVSQVSFAVSGSSVWANDPSDKIAVTAPSVKDSAAGGSGLNDGSLGKAPPVADAGVLGKPTHIRAKILIAPHNE